MPQVAWFYLAGFWVWTWSTNTCKKIPPGSSPRSPVTPHTDHASCSLAEDLMHQDMTSFPRHNKNQLASLGLSIPRHPYLPVWFLLRKRSREKACHTEALLSSCCGCSPNQLPLLFFLSQPAMSAFRAMQWQTGLRRWMHSVRSLRLRRKLWRANSVP